MFNINFSYPPKTSRNEFILILIFCFLILCTAIYSLIEENYKFAFLILTVPLSFVLILKFEKYYDYYLIFLMFFTVNFYYPLRLQPVLILSLISLFFFYLNKASAKHNKFLLPKSIKISASVLIFFIVVSEIFSLHSNLQSFYFAFLFIIYTLFGYIFFRNLTDSAKLDSYLKFYIYSFLLSGIVIIIQIILSGRIRSTGFSGYAIIDFSVIALLILVFRYVIMGPSNFILKLSILVSLMVMITTQSRFAWLGFVLSFIYGIIICYSKSGEANKIIKQRIPLIFIMILLLTGFVFISGMHNIILDRFITLDFDFFSATDDRTLVANSLETRLLIWTVALNAFMQNQLTGVGFLMFSEVSEVYNVLPQFLFDDFVKGLDAHTTYFNLLVETGILGFLSYITFIITVFVVSLKSVKLAQNNNETNNSLILNILVFFIMVHSIYSGAFTFGQNAFSMYFIFGMTAGYHVYLKNKYSVCIKNDSDIL